MTGSLCSKRSPKCPGGHSHSSGLSREQCFNSQSVGLTRAVVSLSLQSVARWKIVCLLTSSCTVHFYTLGVHESLQFPTECFPEKQEMLSISFWIQNSKQIKYGSPCFDLTPWRLVRGEINLFSDKLKHVSRSFQACLDNL